MARMDDQTRAAAKHAIGEFERRRRHGHGHLAGLATAVFATVPGWPRSTRSC